MSQPHTIEITHVWRPPLALTIREQSRVRFYATAYSEEPEGAGWAQGTNGRYWRLEVPPSVYQALQMGEDCAVLWQGEECLGALDWKAREEEPNATAYQVDPAHPSGHVSAYEGDVTRASDGKPVLLGRIDADPDAEWWLVVSD